MNLSHTPQRARGEALNPLRRALLEFVRARPSGCTFAQVAAATGHLPGGSGANLRANLNYLANKDQLHHSGDREHKRWYPGPRPAPGAAPNVALPRQVQVMFGPVYVPPRGPALRAGALDHQACASRGHAC